MSHQNISIAELTFIAQTNLAAKCWQPMILLGSPGTAKTTWVKDVLPGLYADSLGVSVDDIGFEIERPARRDAVEMAGICLPNNDDNGELITTFSKPPIITAIEKKGKTYGIILVDEIAAARDPEQKVWRDAFDPAEHSIGGWDLPAGWIVIGTGNRAQDKSGSGRLMAHLINVALVFNIEFKISGLVRWWKENNGNPIVIECAEAHAEQQFFADSVPAEDIAFCSPRSLFRASQHLDAFIASNEFTGIIPPLMERMLAANIGPGAASTVVQWVAQRDHVPTAEQVLADPESAKVPDQTGFQMIAANVAMNAVTDCRSAEAVLHYIVRLRPDLQVSLGVKLLRISTEAGWTVTDPLASAFIAKFHSLLPLAVQ